MKRILTFILAVMASAPLAAQRYPERGIVRAGNRQYERENYVEAEINYRRALEKSPECYEATANLAKSLYKQKRWDEAAGLFGRIAVDSLHRSSAAATWYDNGNALFQQRKLEEAIEAYKQSLRINPSDQEAKFNLAYAQKLLDKNKGGGDDDKDNKDNKDNQQDQQKQPEPRPAQPKDAREGMSEQEAAQILQAMQMSEDKTREKVDEKKPKEAPRGKNW